MDRYRLNTVLTLFDRRHRVLPTERDRRQIWLKNS